MAHGDIDHGSELRHIISVCSHIFTKAVNNGIHHIIVADEINLLVWAVEHMERSIDVFVDIETIRRRGTILCKNRWTFCNAIHSKTPKALLIIVNTDHIIAIAVPHEMKWRDYIWLTVAFSIFLS